MDTLCDFRPQDKCHAPAEIRLPRLPGSGGAGVGGFHARLKFAGGELRHNLI
jgi:hypothetical protein